MNEKEVMKRMTPAVANDRTPALAIIARSMFEGRVLYDVLINVTANVTCPIEFPYKARITCASYSTALLVADALNAGAFGLYIESGSIGE
jgi:hypothetical protein